MSLKNTFLIKEAVAPFERGSEESLQLTTYTGEVEKRLGNLRRKLRQNLPRDKAASEVRFAAQEIEGILESYAQYLLSSGRAPK